MKILVTGGGGYVGSSLIPKLLNKGHQVTVLDLFLYGADVLDSHSHLTCISGDIRDQAILKKSLEDVDIVIHLACISNDPSFELNPTLGKEINFDAFEPLVKLAKNLGVKRFIYASSSSVYGVKSERDVVETGQMEPLTDYSKYKSLCEDILLNYQSNNFTTVIIRPATVCGYSRRQRLDVVVNILTNHAYHNKKIKIFGGDQLRPNIHIEDMTDLYLLLVDVEDSKIAGKVFNAGGENLKVSDIAQIVKKKIGNDVVLEKVSSDDIRSYHICSDKISRELNFIPKKNVLDAITDLENAFKKGLLPDSLEDPKYFNVKLMNKVNLR
jgi:nucleoside-diphosphate-sugar epimerase